MKKFLPYIVILIILVGIFSPLIKVEAQISPNVSIPGQTTAATQKLTVQDNDGSAFKEQIDGGCGLNPFTWSFDGCILKFVYYTYFQIPTFILWLSALIFNVLIRIGLDSTMTSSSGFISAAWAVVRDLSNIFFILVLLYVAIQTILGLGHETKKMIVKVIIMALLINFSMFFTKVVIDTSNILALVFYNRLDVTAGRQYIPSTPNKEKDISGEMYKAFRATDLLTPEYLKKVQNETSGQTLLPLALKLGLIGISGTIMLFAAYAFFVSGFMFLGRLIELWVLIIFSPFAFMSSAIPKLAGVEYIGWEDWSKRLISTTFMAPIFMLFMYLIFLLLRANPFENFFDKNTGFVATILGVLIPSLLIIALLLKATKYAEKGGGAFGEIVMKGAKFAGGLAVTAAAAAASGGTALAARVVIGGAGGALASKLAEKAGPGRIANTLKNVKSFAQNRSFDVRNTSGAIKGLAKAGGSMLSAQQGGWEGMKKSQIEKRVKRADEIEEKGTKKEKKEVEMEELKLKAATLPVKLDLEDADKKIDKLRNKLKDVKLTDDGSQKSLDEIEDAKIKLNEAKVEKDKIKTNAGLDNFEKNVKKAKQTLQDKKVEIRVGIATKIEGGSKIENMLNAIRSFGSYRGTEREEAGLRIRAETKVESHSQKETEKTPTPRAHPPVTSSTPPPPAA